MCEPVWFRLKGRHQLGTLPEHTALERMPDELGAPRRPEQPRPPAAAPRAEPGPAARLAQEQS